MRLIPSTVEKLVSSIRKHECGTNLCHMFRYALAVFHIQPACVPLMFRDSFSPRAFFLFFCVATEELCVTNSGAHRCTSMYSLTVLLVRSLISFRPTLFYFFVWCVFIKSKSVVGLVFLFHNIFSILFFLWYNFCIVFSFSKIKICLVFLLFVFLVCLFSF